MAPEIFMHTMAEGHGRAADIWSVGCVVVEMGTGRVKILCTLSFNIYHTYVYYNLLKYTKLTTM